MPGRPRRPGTSDSRGGARAGAGRKSKPLSPRTVQRIRTVVDKRAKKEGRTVADILLDFVYGAEGVTTPQRIRAAKTILEYYFKGNYEEPAEEEKVCAIQLPPRRPDPAKLLFGEQKDKQ